MDNFEVGKFDPSKAKVIEITDQYKNIKINGIEDENGYEIAKIAKKELQTLRTNIKKYGKAKRDEAIQYQKAIIKSENELVEIVEKVENPLKEQIGIIDAGKEMIRMKKYLPDRKKKLEEIGIEISDEENLQMDNTQFDDFLNARKLEIFEENQRKLQEEKDKLDAEKAKIENDRLIAEAKEQGKKEAEENAKRQREEDKRQAELDKVKAVEDERDRVKFEKEKKEQEEKEEMQGKKYQDFLVDNGYNGTEDFYILKLEDKTILYKKIAELEIK